MHINIFYTVKNVLFSMNLINISLVNSNCDDIFSYYIHNNFNYYFFCLFTYIFLTTNIFIYILFIFSILCENIHTKHDMFDYFLYLFLLK